HVGRHGRVPRDVADYVRAGHRDARPRRPLRERPALQHRAGRAPLQRPARDGQGRGDAPLPRREPRALALGLARAPRDAVRGDPRVVRALPPDRLTQMRRRLPPLLLLCLLGLAAVSCGVSTSPVARPSVWGPALEVPGTAILDPNSNYDDNV